ncbi:MAG TPA: hypothetical protein VHX49_08485 [Candidatus Acidoferrales bacterium]|nr:hypothetical protein [Candidatus Acidoferrales bacterium]
MKQRIEHVVHTEILREREGRFAKRIRLGRGGLGQPEIRGHLFFRRFSRGEVAQDDKVPSGQVVGLGAVLGEDRPPVLSNHLDLAAAVLLGEEILPLARKLEAIERISHEIGPPDAKKREGGRIRLKTHSTVIQNHEAIQRAVEDGLKLILGGPQAIDRFALLAAGKDEETDVERDRCGKGNQDESQQGGRQWARVQPRQEGGQQQGNNRERDQDRAGVDTLSTRPLGMC